MQSKAVLRSGFRGRAPGVWRQRSGSPTLQAFQSAGQHDNGVTGFVRWPRLSHQRGSAEERAAYFSRLQSSNSPGADDSPPVGKQATTLMELMTIRAYHSRTLRRYSLGTALGMRTKGGKLTDLPAILVFVARKVHEQWLLDSQKLPRVLHGPEGHWCDVDVVEFSYYGKAGSSPSEQVYTEVVEGLRGKDPNIGPGSQVASEEMYGTLGAVVRSRRNNKQLGFLTNCHVAVDFNQPKQKMYHPLPPSLGPGMYLGSVERATSFTSDYAWYGCFAGEHAETFVRADGAFIPFWENFDLQNVRTSLKGIGRMGEVYSINLDDKISTVVGRCVFKLGGSSGLTRGTIMAYAVEYTDDKGICFFTDFLILGENGRPFDIEGDSGSLLMFEASVSSLPQPIGIIWGGTANRGRLKLRNGNGPEDWTSGVDIGRLLDLLELDLVTTSEELKVVAMERQEKNDQEAEQKAPADVEGHGEFDGNEALDGASSRDGKRAAASHDSSSVEREQKRQRTDSPRGLPAKDLQDGR